MNGKKRCSVCCKEHAIDFFNKKKGSKDGHVSACKECTRERSKNNYNINKEKHKSIVRKRKLSNVEKLKKFKESVQCVVCGEAEICCIVLYGGSEEWLGKSLTHLVNDGYSWSRIEKELEYRIPICFNCNLKRRDGLLEIPSIP